MDTEVNAPARDTLVPTAGEGAGPSSLLHDPSDSVPSRAEGTLTRVRTGGPSRVAGERRIGRPTTPSLPTSEGVQPGPRREVLGECETSAGPEESGVGTGRRLAHARTPTDLPVFRRGALVITLMDTSDQEAVLATTAEGAALLRAAVGRPEALGGTPAVSHTRADVPPAIRPTDSLCTVTRVTPASAVPLETVS